MDTESSGSPALLDAERGASGVLVDGVDGTKVKKVLTKVETAPDREYPPPPNAFTRAIEPMFKIYERGSTFGTEIRAGCVLFMASAYILFLNPLILSGGSSNFITGMPATDVALATSISTGVATTFMAIMGNYPWVVSVQLGTNTYFVNNVLQIGKKCGYHAHFYGAYGDPCTGVPCSCNADKTVVIEATTPGNQCFNTTASCLGTKVPYEQALACTFLEGIVFVAICLFGIRPYLLKIFPKSVLMAGAAGIGAFIATVGTRSAEIIVAAPYPTLTGLNTQWPYVFGGWGGNTELIGFNDCVMYFGGPPYGPVCPWLPVGGFLLTSLLLLWNVHGALIIGIFFTMFASWIKFPGKLNAAVDPGLVPATVAFVPKFQETAGSINFNWGDNTSDLIAAFFMFLYLDFIGSCITFVAMGQMCGLIDKDGNIPRSNMAFSADGVATTIGGLLGTSALTTYVESASAVKEGGRTGVAAMVCALFFFASVFLAPLFSSIPDIATGPILMLIGVLIFMSAIWEISWMDLTEAIPAFTTILGMPLTNNIAYGIIGGLAMYVICKFFTYQLFPDWPLYQKRWYGREWWMKNADTSSRGMFCRVPGFNTDIDPDVGPVLPDEPWWFDLTVIRLYKETKAHMDRRKGPIAEDAVGYDEEEAPPKLHQT